MIVYIDYIFIENLIMNYLLLVQTKKIAKENSRNIKIVISSIIGALYVCIMAILKLKFLNYSVCKILLSFVMIYIAFTPKKIAIYIKEILIFIFILIINIGTYLTLIYLFNMKMNSNAVKIALYIFGYIVIYIASSEAWKMFKLKLKKSNLICDVYIKNNNEYVVYKGFVDTGNNSKDVLTGRPVFYANIKKNINLNDKKKVEIPVTTIAGEYYMQGYEYDDVIIKKGKKETILDAVICFTEEKIDESKGYEMIINFDVYEEMLGGIYI